MAEEGDDTKNASERSQIRISGRRHSHTSFAGRHIRDMTCRTILPKMALRLRHAGSSHYHWSIRETDYQNTIIRVFHWSYHIIIDIGHCQTLHRRRHWYQ